MIRRFGKPAKHRLNPVWRRIAPLQSLRCRWLE